MNVDTKRPIDWKIRLGTAVCLLSACQTAQHKALEIPATAQQKEVASARAAKLAYELGKKALLEKDGKAAIAHFSKCLVEKSGNSDCHWELGWSYFLEHRFEGAKSEWEIVQQLEPKRAGLREALKKITSHLELRKRALATRTNQPPSFNLRRKPASSKIIRIHAVGDMMLGTDYPSPMLPPQNTSPLRLAKGLLKGADITFANHEGTLCDEDANSKCDDVEGACFAFRSPPNFAGLLKDAGFDLISLANNHIMDFGEICRERTEQALDQAGIPWSGRPETVARFERKGVRISMIAFHSAPHTNSTLELEMAKDLVIAEKKQKRLVIVSFHGGAEGFPALHTPRATETFMNENRGHVVEFSRKMVEAGADLVLGSGPHVVRAMEIYKDRLIAYSLGNFSTYKAFNIWGFAGIGMVLEADLNRRGRFVAGRIIPVRQIGFGVPAYDTRMTAVDLVRVLASDDFPKTGVEVARDGTIRKRTATRRILSKGSQTSGPGSDRRPAASGR